ncbi:MAG: lipopolysaccharide transport periplasmic protein LptA [Pseudomonadales bacterium]|nr:lipopolysaccharide transport periplasmic protein LptA [Pseudomonadales bacterium]
MSIVGINLWALPSDAEQPIHIKADKAEMAQKDGTATYLGNVRLDRGTMRVNAEKMVIELNENDELTRLTARGKNQNIQAHFQQQVEVNKPDVQADADVIIYFADKDKIELRGNAHLTQDENELSGELIIYDVRTGRVDASASPGEKLDIIFQPAAVKLP